MIPASRAIERYLTLNGKPYEIIGPPKMTVNGSQIDVEMTIRLKKPLEFIIMVDVATVSTPASRNSVPEIIDVKNYVTPLEQFVLFEFNDETMCRVRGVPLPISWEVGAGCPSYLVPVRHMEKLTPELEKAGIVVRYRGIVCEPRFNDPTWQTLNKVTPYRVP